MGPDRPQGWRAWRDALARVAQVAAVASFGMPYLTVRDCSSKQTVEHFGYELLARGGWLYLVPLLVALALLALSFWRRPLDRALLGLGLAWRLLATLAAAATVAVMPGLLFLFDAVSPRYGLLIALGAWGWLGLDSAVRVGGYLAELFAHRPAPGVAPNAAALALDPASPASSAAGADDPARWSARLAAGPTPLLLAGSPHLRWLAWLLLAGPALLALAPAGLAGLEGWAADQVATTFGVSLVLAALLGLAHWAALLGLARGAAWAVAYALAWCAGSLMVAVLVVLSFLSTPLPERGPGLQGVSLLAALLGLAAALAVGRALAGLFVAAARR